MIPTAPCWAKGPGVLKRTAEEFGRMTRMMYNMDALTVPGKPYYLLDFENADTVNACKTIADRAVGGYSTASLDYVSADPAALEPAHVRFHGSISTKLPPNWRIQRSGYAAFRNHTRGWLFGRLYWDMDPYKYLALRVKSDGRRYTINVQTDSIVDSDLHQHRLFTHHHREGHTQPTPELASATFQTTPERTSGPDTAQQSLADASRWETVFIKWTDFVRTNHGVAVEPQTDITKHRIRSVGIGLTDRVEGPYDLRVHRIWATNGMTSEELAEEQLLCKGMSSSVTMGEDGSARIDGQSQGFNLQGLQKMKGLQRRS
ncbi:hypothetical protein KEM52_004978 [Ascosphaera acerosa]|nr:hypothetical protein KEM52_004978 [Ascosphaera acerosa]